MYNFLNKNWPINVCLIPNGYYDYNGYEEVEYSDKENIICTVGRIGDKNKNNELLLEAFARCCKDIPNWKLKLIGSIEEDFNIYIENYYKMYPELNDKVIFTGNIFNKTLLNNEHKKSKIFCLTSFSEGFPLVFPEALRNGCFIISINVNSAIDITDDQKLGLILKNNTVEELSNALKNCAINDLKKNDFEKIKKYAKGKFYWPVIIKKIHEYLI